MKTNRNLILGFTAAAGMMLPAFAAGLLGGGCADKKPADKPAEKKVEPAKAEPASLTTIKSEIVATKAQVDTTTESLNMLAKSSPDQAQANYNKYTEEYLKLKAKSDWLRERTDDLKDRTAAYYASWNKQAEVQNPELRRQALEQRANAEKSFSNIKGELEQTRNAFQPYMSNLKDVGSYLKDNVTPAGIKSIGDLATKADGQAKEVAMHADALVAEIDKITAATGEVAAPKKVE